MIARKKPGSSAAERLTPSNTTGPAKAPDTTISYATCAPMLNPTITSAPTLLANKAVIRAYSSAPKSYGAGAPACPGIVTAINRVLDNAGTAITSAYERALHIPPGSSKTVCAAPAGPDSTISQLVSTAPTLRPPGLACHEAFTSSDSPACRDNRQPPRRPGIGG